MAKKQLLIYLTNSIKTIICILNHCIKGQWARSGNKWKCSPDRKINLAKRAELCVIPHVRKGHQRKILEIINHAKIFFYSCIVLSSKSLFQSWFPPSASAHLHSRHTSPGHSLPSLLLVLCCSLSSSHCFVCFSPAPPLPNPLTHLFCINLSRTLYKPAAFTHFKNAHPSIFLVIALSHVLPSQPENIRFTIMSCQEMKHNYYFLVKTTCKIWHECMLSKLVLL